MGENGGTSHTIYTRYILGVKISLKWVARSTPCVINEWLLLTHILRLNNSQNGAAHYHCSWLRIVILLAIPESSFCFDHIPGSWVWWPDFMPCLQPHNILNNWWLWSTNPRPILLAALIIGINTFQWRSWYRVGYRQTVMGICAVVET